MTLPRNLIYQGYCKIDSIPLTISELRSYIFKLSLLVFSDDGLQCTNMYLKQIYIFDFSMSMYTSVRAEWNLERS